MNQGRGRNALVLSIEEKPSIQALERAQGWLRLPNGKSLTGFSQQYKRPRHYHHVRSVECGYRHGHGRPL